MFELQNYPVLKSVRAVLNQHTPVELLNKYSQNQYNLDELDASISPEQATKDVKFVIGNFNGLFLKRRVYVDASLIIKLKNEKDIQVRKIQTDNKNEIPFQDWYDNQVLGIINAYCNNVHENMEWIFGKYYNDAMKDRLKIQSSFSKWNEQFSKPAFKINDPVIADPIDLLEPGILPLFYDAEKKALNIEKRGKEFTFDSNIRCAAFCQILYDEGWILKTKHKKIRMNDFAKGRYKLDINKALHTSKEVDRNDHITKSISRKKPLKSCFLSLKKRY